MTREDVIRMAREADAAHDEVSVHPFLERFASLVAAAEREECAKVCDEVNRHFRRYQAQDCATAIRASGNQ